VAVSAFYYLKAPSFNHFNGMKLPVFSVFNGKKYYKNSFCPMEILILTVLITNEVFALESFLEP